MWENMVGDVIVDGYRDVDVNRKLQERVKVKAKAVIGVVLNLKLQERVKAKVKMKTSEIQVATMVVMKMMMPPQRMVEKKTNHTQYKRIRYLLKRVSLGMTQQISQGSTLSFC